MKTNCTPPSKISILKITFLFLLFGGTYSLVAQAPGGVSTGLELWLKADSGSKPSSPTAAEWLVQSPNAIVFTANLVQGPDPDSAPTLGEGTMNFNPSLIFDGIDTGLATAIDGADFGFSESSVLSLQKAPKNDNGGTIAQHTL